MSTGMMIPAGRQMPSMMGRRTSGTTFGTTSSGLMLSENDLLFSLTGRDMYVKEDAGEQNPVVNGQHQHQDRQHHHQNHLNQQVEINQDNTQGEVGRVQEDEFESKSGSDNLEGVSGDDLQDPNYRPMKKKKRYHRHTQHQIQEMESFFRECPHPDDKLRKELSRELGLEPLQVKFWFQNKRTQMKTQNERSENTNLRNENEKLRAENMRYRETVLSNISCPNCGGPTAIGEMSFDEQHLRIENARLKEEIDRLSGIAAAKYVNKPIPPYHFPSRHNVDLLPGTASDFFGPPSDLTRPVGNNQQDLDKPAVVELAVAAMEELVRLAQLGEPLWVPGGSESDNPNEVLNEEEYVRSFPRVIGPRPFDLRSEASRASAVVIMNHVSVVEMLMDLNQWSTVFSGIVSKATMVQVLSTGVAGNFNGAIQVMSAETQLPSPLVPTRETHFIRYCKQHSDKSWAVVDVSLDETLRPNQSMIRNRRRPSGCLIKEMPNGYSKVIWVEHVEVEDQCVHQMYKSVVNSCLGFGAKRWISTLERQCERLASLMATNIPSGEIGVIASREGRRSMMKLAERMVMSFYNGVGASTTHQWTTLSGSAADNVRVITRKSIDDPGRPSGIVLNAATSFWIPTPPGRVFDFLRDENSRTEWDILSNGGIVQEMAHIANGQEQGNCVSLLRVNSASSNQSNMLILQETSTDQTGSFVVYAPVDIVAMNIVLNGGDPDYVALLPSGFAILPDGSGGGGGSLLTVAFQILVDSVPTAKPSLGSVATVNSLISCTVERIKGALVGDGG